MNNKAMVHASLFSGIGGFELPAHWMGWTNLFHCEIDPFPRKVIQYYWPQSISYEDIRNTDFTIHRGSVDVLSGGFPCQPYSISGKRLGTNDERHLWPEMLRAIRQIQPVWVVGENVRGIVSWNAGLVFEEVQADLEAQGYEVQSFVLPAASVGAPHIRQRVFFIAYSASNRRIRERTKPKEEAEQKRLWKIRQLERRSQRSCISQSTAYASSITRNQRHSKITHFKQQWPAQEYISKGSDFRSRTTTVGRNRATPNTKSVRPRKIPIESSKTRSCKSSQLFRFIYRIPSVSRYTSNSYISRFEKQHFPSITSRSRFGSRSYHEIIKYYPSYTYCFRRWKEVDRKRKSRLINKNSKGNHWQDFPTQSPVCSGDDGVSSELDRFTIPEITLRRKSIEAYGNAVVPQLILRFFKTIDKYHRK